MNHLDHIPIYGYFFKSMRDLFMISRTIKIYVLWYVEWRKYTFYDTLNEENIGFMMRWMRKIYVLWCIEWGKYTFYDALNEETIRFMMRWVRKIYVLCWNIFHDHWREQRGLGASTSSINLICSLTHHCSKQLTVSHLFAN